MHINRISPETYARFVSEQEHVMYTQLPEHLQTRSETGFEVEYLGLVDGDQASGDEHLVASAGLLIHPWKRVFSRAVLTFGPVVASDLSDGDQREALVTFFRLLPQILAKHPRRILACHVAPAVVKRNFDDVTPLEQTQASRELSELFDEIGARAVTTDFTESDDIQVRYFYSKDIEGQSFPQLVKGMSQQVRTAFNRWGKNGVSVRFAAPEEIDILRGVLASTIERTDMQESITADYAIEFDRKLAQNLGPDKAFFPVAELHTGEYLENLAAESAELTEQITAIDEQERELTEQGKNLGKKQRTRRGELKDRLNVLAKRTRETERLREEHGEVVVLAASMFIAVPNELVYLISGAYAEFNSYYGIYLIHRAMMEWAVDHGLHRYNFWGISGDFSEDATDAGVLHFKRQFGGDARELMGTYNIPVRGRLASLLGAL